VKGLLFEVACRLKGPGFGKQHAPGGIALPQRIDLGLLHVALRAQAD